MSGRRPLDGVGPVVYSGHRPGTFRDPDGPAVGRSLPPVPVAAGPFEEHVMATTHSHESLARLYRDLGFQPLSHWWGRGEMLAGLLGVAVSVCLMLFLAVEALHSAGPKDTIADRFFNGTAVGAVFLFALGGYLTLAGHRRHLYESNDRLTAYLAELVREQGDRAGDPSATAAPVPANGPPAAPAPV